MEAYRNESAQKVDPGDNNYPAAPARTGSRDLSTTSRGSTTELISLPGVKSLSTRGSSWGDCAVDGTVKYKGQRTVCGIIIK